MHQGPAWETHGERKERLDDEAHHPGSDCCRHIRDHLRGQGRHSPVPPHVQHLNAEAVTPHVSWVFRSRRPSCSCPLCFMACRREGRRGSVIGRDRAHDRPGPGAHWLPGSLPNAGGCLPVVPRFRVPAIVRELSGFNHLSCVVISVVASANQSSHAVDVLPERVPGQPWHQRGCDDE